MTIDPTSALTTAYWDNFLSMSGSSVGRDWDRLDQVEQIVRAGGGSATDMVLDLIETAPAPATGGSPTCFPDRSKTYGVAARPIRWPSSRPVVGPLHWPRRWLHLNAPSTREPERAARKAKRPSKRQGNRPKHP